MSENSSVYTSNFSFHITQVVTNKVRKRVPTTRLNIHTSITPNS